MPQKAIAGLPALRRGKESIFLEDGSENGFFSIIKSLLKKKTHLDNSNDLAEEIHELIDEGQAKGLITNEESHMVCGVLDLKETQVHSIMVPRTEISSAPLDSSLGHMISLICRCGHTRIPLHNGNIDDIVGILHAKDLLRLWGKEPASSLPPDILREPFYVPGSRKIAEVLRDLQNKKTHLAVVTDEYGGTAGIITVEDILEEIVGEIMDEHDTEEPLLTVIDQASIMVDARLGIEKLEEQLGMELPRGDYESVGGFIIQHLGRIPEINETVFFEDLEFIVQKADQRKVDTILVTRREPATFSDTDGDGGH